MTSEPSLLDQHAPWSLSKSDLAAKCSLAFRLRYIDRVARAEGAEAKIGTAAHSVQEYILKHVNPRTALERVFEATPNLTSKERDAVEALLPAFTDYYARIQRFKERKGITEEYFEQQWAIDRNFNAVEWDSPDVLFRGIVDYAMVTPDGYLLVHDHKSGRDKGISPYANQLDSYAVLGLSVLPGVKGVQGALHYMKTKNIVWHTMRDAHSIQHMLRPWLLHLLTQRANKLAQHVPSVSNLCKWCDYRAHCPEGLAHIELITPKRKPRKRKKSEGDTL